MRNSAARRLAVASAFAAAVLALGPANAEGPADGTAGFVGRGDATVQTAFSGFALTLGANVAFEERGERIRLDVLSLAVPGVASALGGSLATQLFPAGGFSIAYDQRNGTYAVWSAAHHAFFTGSTPAAPATPAPNPNASAAGDLFGIFGPLRSLKDDKSLALSVALTGHSTLFGHPVTNAHFDFERSPLAGNDALSVRGDLAVADDLSGLPLQITIDSATKSIPISFLRIELPQVTRRTPPDADFEPPAGYARAASVGDAIGGKITPQL